MRHRKDGRKFGRNTSHRRAMFRSLLGNLVIHERIQTTEAKAKELRRVAERTLSFALRLGDHLTADVTKLPKKEQARVLARRVHAQRLMRYYMPAKRLGPTTKGGVGSQKKSVDPLYKLFHELAPRYLERVKKSQGGGYTRIIKVGQRRGDGAPLAFIEFI